MTRARPPRVRFDLAPVSPAARLFTGLTTATAQVTAAVAGILAWPLALGAVVVSLVVAGLPATANAGWRRLSSLMGTGVVAVTAVVIGRGTASAGSGDYPLASLHALVIALTVLAVLLPAGWRSVREHRMWLGVAAGLLVAAAASSHQVLPLLAVGGLLALVAAIVLQSDAVAGATDGRPGVPAARGPGPGSPVALAVIALTGMLAAAAWAVVPQRLGGASLAADLAHRVRPGDATGAVDRSVAGVDTSGTGVLDLSVRGALPHTPLIAVPARTPPLWRGTVYRSYTGRSWLAAAGPRHVQLHRGGDVRLHPRARRDGHRSVVTDEVRLLHPGLFLVWAPGQVLRVRGQMNGVVSQQGSVKLFGLSEPSYRVTAAVTTTDAPALRRVPSPAGGGASPWLRLPAELPARVRALAHRITAGDATTWQEVADVESYLRSHERYSLDSPVPAPGRDAVDEFLFHDHIGFCEQFASAATVLLRAVGVPSRVVSGLAYGRVSDGARILTEADAHAWVEVRYPGVGWSATDPTAGVALATPARSWWSTLTGWLRALPWPALLLLAVVAAAALSLLRRLPGPRLRSGTPAGAGPVQAAFRRLLARQRRSRRRLPNETPREWAARTAIPGLEPALAVLEEELWSARPPEGARVDDAVETFERAGR